MAENEIEAGLRPMTGVEDVVVGATVVVGDVSIWFSPGMEAESFCMPRPPDELPPVPDEPGAATPDSADRPDAVDVVGLERVPAAESDVVVVVVELFAGATVLDVVEFRAVESLV
jgi:hypothetical protein